MLLPALTLALLPSVTLGCAMRAVCAAQGNSAASQRQTPVVTTSHLEGTSAHRQSSGRTDKDSTGATYGHESKDQEPGQCGPDTGRTDAPGIEHMAHDTQAHAQATGLSADVSVSAALRTLLRVSVYSFLLARYITLCMLLVCTTVLHGHILVWAIIAPRFVFELFFVLVAVCGVGLGCLFL